MKELYLKNVIGNEATASKLTSDMLGILLRVRLPLGQRRSSSWKPPEGYLLEKVQVGDLPIERIAPSKGKNGKAILILHGGGYVWPLLDLNREQAIQYSKYTDGAEVINVNYRIAPTNPYPAALEDSVTAYKWLLEQGYKGEDILLIGDSAGAGLALAVTLYLKDNRISLPKGVIALSPWSDVDDKSPSRYINDERDIVLGSKGLSVADQVHKHAYAGDWDLKIPYLSPVYGEYIGFPKLLLQAGTFEVLYDDSVRVYEKAKAAGVDVRLSSYYGMPHCFQQTFPDIPESKKAWEEVKSFMRETFNLG